MEPDEVEVAQRFARDLATLHQLAGKPSYSILERVSDQQLRRATVSDILNGNRVRVPDWRFVAAFVTACRKVAAQTGLNPDEVATLDDWKHRWDNATGASGVARPEQPSQPESPRAATASVPSVWGGVPPRLRDFFGREDLLADVRRALVRENRTSAVAIQGLCGIGKTKLAIEYAHRYAEHYDLVWWIPCDDLPSARTAMAGLESRLGLAGRPRNPREGPHIEIFDRLRRGLEYPRWLMIFDNANEPNDIRYLLPPRNGHVLITSRNNRWSATEDMLEMDVFGREESVDFLRHRMRGVSESDAHRLADGVGDLPLALEHAVESRLSVPEYLSRLASDPLGLLASQPSDYPSTITDAWGAILNQLVHGAEYAIDFLYCLSFFEGGSVSRELLDKGRHRHDISVHELLRDTMQCNRAITALGRVGLLRVHPATSTLQIHRLTQCVVRAIVADERAADIERRKHDVHLLLANDDPGDPEDPAAWRRYEELRGAIGHSDMTDCRADLVRRLIINLVRYLHASGDPRAAVNLADSALVRWSADGGVSDPEANAGYLDMQEAKVEALLTEGSCETALRVQHDALLAMQSNPDRWSRQIVALSRVTGAGLRMDGKFKDALAADSAAREGHIATFGQDHPQTVTAINNLAIDHALDGNYADALREAERGYSYSVAYGNVDNMSLLFQRNLLARCMQLAGYYDEAWELLTEVNADYNAMVERGLLSEDHPRLLAHEIDFTAARQDRQELGVAEQDLAGLAQRLNDIQIRCWRALDVDHPQTLAAAVVRGSILRRIPGRIPEAAAVVNEATRRYQATLGDHPYTFACAAFLAGIHRQGGSLVRAVSELEAALAGLRRLVGERHPCTLAATVGLMNALADAGEPEAALARGQVALAGFQDSLSRDHPHTLACAANLAAVLGMVNRLQEAAELRDETASRYAATTGAGHYHARLLAAGMRFDLDFSPLPL